MLGCVVLRDNLGERRRRPAGAFLLAVQGPAPAVAVDVDFKDGGVVDDAIDGGSVIAGSGKMRPHSPKPLVAVISMERRS